MHNKGTKIHLNKRLGQHILVNKTILHEITKIAEIKGDDKVLEIGAGPGNLTRLLANRAKQVIAMEIDDRLLTLLAKNLSDFKNVEIVKANALNYDYSNIGGRFKVVSNLPYYIATPIIFRLMKYKSYIDCMVLSVQKEVAERIVATPGGKSFGPLSIALQLYNDTSICLDIPKEAFRPVPKVNSSLVRLIPYPEPKVKIIDEDLFPRIVKASFAHRRKTLKNNLKVYKWDGLLDDLLRNLGIDPGRRAETLSIEEFAAIANLITLRRKGHV